MLVSIRRNCGSKLVNGEWSAVSGEWSVVSGEWELAIVQQSLKFPNLAIAQEFRKFVNPLTTHHSQLTTHNSFDKSYNEEAPGITGGFFIIYSYVLSNFSP